jgi:hypothetical protein
MDQKHAAWLEEFYEEMSRQTRVPQRHHEYGGFLVRRLLTDGERLEIAASEISESTQAETARARVFEFRLSNDPKAAASEVATWMRAQPEYQP